MFKYILLAIAFFIFTIWWCQNNNQPKQSNNISSNINQNIVYLDVREDNERDEWHISGAIHLSLWELEAWKTEKLPKDKTLAIYCRSWRRSAIALSSLKSQWFSNVIDLWGMNSIKWVEIVK